MVSSEILIDIQKRFRRGPEISALLSFGHVPVTILFGPSGCGKSTVLRCLAGIDTPSTGLIRSGGETWFDSAIGINVRPQHRQIGFVFQENSLFPHLSVRANIAYGLARNRGMNARIDEMIDMFDLHDLQHRRPGQLSGGQRQRIALARALAPRPHVLLLDEPFASLDAPKRSSLRAELRSLVLQSGTPALIVTHDRSEALALGDEIAVMADGNIRQCGPVQQVFSRPADSVVAAAVGMETVTAGDILTSADSVSEVRVGQTILTACNPHNCIGHVLVCIRGEDVLLFQGTDDRIKHQSARNQLPARVDAIQPDGPLSRIFLDCGFSLTALITRQSCEELRLVQGARVTALIKATNVHLLPRETSAITVPEWNAHALQRKPA